MTTGKLCRKTIAATMAIAVCAALTVHAATPLNWTGGEKATSTEESPYDIWNAANWGGTTPNGSYDLYISTNGTTYLNSEVGTTRICADLCPNSGDFVFTGPLQFYCLKQGRVANSTVSITKKSGDWNVQVYGMYIGYASGTKATFVNESGYIKSTGQYKGIHIGCAPGATGIVENVLGNLAFEGDMFLAETNDTVKSDTVATFVNKSDVTVRNIKFGTYDAASGTGTLTIKGGTVTTAEDTCFYRGDSTINLDGGTLVTRRIERLAKNDSIPNINFNGGTLKVNKATYTTATKPFIYSPYGDMYVTVNAGGGTIDCSGYAIIIETGAGNKYNHTNGIRGDGGLTFTGGNTITISNKVTYAGATRITPGTTLAVIDADAKANILSHGIVVDGFPTAGQTVFICTNAFDNADLANVSCPCAPATTFAFGDENKTNIVVSVPGSLDWTKYSHRFKVSFSGYAGSETLANFPVLVKISESGISGFRYADCKKPGGADLRFADESGNLLASEVDTWDTNGVSLVWVKVPSLTAATKITAYYGWDFAPVVDSSAVWTGNGYVGVWHLNESCLPLAESSGFSSPFTAGSYPQYVDCGEIGIIGKSVDFSRNYNNGSSYGSTRLEAADDDGHLSGLTDFTVECWTYQTNYWTTGSAAAMVSKGEGAASDQRPWKVYQDHTTLKSGFEVTEFEDTSTNRASAASSRGVNTGEWTHQTFVRNYTCSTNRLVYFNGENVGSRDEKYSSTLSNTKPLILGGGGVGGTARVFPGSIDEVRVSNVARSADWVKASHDTVTESSFSIYGSARRNVETGMTVIIK